MRTIRILAPCVLGLGLLSGCATDSQTPYQRPAVAVPAQWQNAAPDRQQLQGTRWWTKFGDPQLDTLIDTVLRNNADLAVATLNLRRARLQAGLLDAELAPNFGASGDASISKPLNPLGAGSQNYNASLTPSYELDLWGQLASQRDESAWEVNATAQDRLAVALSLIGTTAQLYWQLAYLDHRLDHAQQDVRDAERIITLLPGRADSDAGRLEAAQAAQALAERQADLSSWQQQRAATQYTLALLANQPPQSTLPAPRALAEQNAPDIPAGIPAEVLSRRPDLQAAEWRLRASLAHVDSTRLSFYPAFTLTGKLGGSSSALLDVFSHPIATLGATVTLPFLHSRSNKLTLQTVQTDYDIAAVRFRHALYQALADTEIALSARQHDLAREPLLQTARQQAQLAETEAARRYQAGSGSLKEWLDQQSARHNAEGAWAENRYRQLNDSMAVYRNIGGDLSTVPSTTGTDQTLAGGLE
ncbi:efflux transporter, outer membrane factor (OMF) lipoprotein, NodT family [Andreprevotia lacus DSM 23236]|jgi:NodT family efflux transporter outer membrane factor (OMF) lipoprotein|uniref:Efflux transporter, outer membrane factor (OMF) lipoprotein, NodT family n=1 Tax=Andreprevotia lacus DSM 23236 TaxID=1121001 RepID=A0A1W1XPF5_9NEIS|nr:efflux transporter outer membrane subunit [Andreprevotia lacus]SMC25849.1 efflux transporter, outer membrane factor (OMF) lipoprotein, NodT family [Andreprevotia lacus DSM 23236]